MERTHYPIRRLHRSGHRPSEPSHRSCRSPLLQLRPSLLSVLLSLGRRCHDGRVYSERPTTVPGVVLWRSGPDQAREIFSVLPDGCMDLLWNGARLSVVGPDTMARWVRPSGGASAALRFSGGVGPALLGLAASELRDTTVGWTDLAPASAHVLEEQVAEDPHTALVTWLTAAAGRRSIDPLGPRVLRAVQTRTPVARIAEDAGLSARQLHRRCLDAFGYGPQHLTRVVRLQDALASARKGLPLARVAAECGYSDQPHLAREVRALTGTTVTALLPPQPGSAANRSTGVPSGSRTTA